MKEITSAVLGVYLQKEQADHGVKSLLAEGFGNEKISILLIEEEGAIDVTQGGNPLEGGSTPVVISSMAIGGTLGLLAGVAALSIPGGGPFIVAGPLLGAITGFGVGGLVGALINSVGVPEDNAKKYEERLKAGGVLLAVHCHTAAEILRAKYLLTATGAMDVSNTGPIPE